MRVRECFAAGAGHPKTIERGDEWLRYLHVLSSEIEPALGGPALVRFQWYSGGERHACVTVGSNGYDIMFVNRDGIAVTDDEGDEPEVQSCAGVATGHYRGEPSAAIVRDLLGDCLR